jgi:hypothetical protein
MSPLDIQAQIAARQAEVGKWQAQANPVPAFNPLQQNTQQYQAPDIQSMIQAEIAKMIPPAAMVPWKQIFEGLAKKALTPDDMAWLEGHIKDDLPGIVHFLGSDTILTLIKMAYDEYRLFLRTPPKEAAKP